MSDNLGTPDGYITVSNGDSKELDAARLAASELITRFRQGLVFRSFEAECGLVPRADGVDYSE